VSAARCDWQAADSTPCGRAVSDDFGKKCAAVASPVESQTSSEGAPSGSALGRGRVEATSASPIARVCARHPVAGAGRPCLCGRPGAWHTFWRRGGALLATCDAVPGNGRLRIGWVGGRATSDQRPRTGGRAVERPATSDQRRLGNCSGDLTRIIHEVSTAAADLYAISALFAARHPRRTVEYASGGSLLR
jgi:hypothetical protein